MKSKNLICSAGVAVLLSTGSQCHAWSQKNAGFKGILVANIVGQIGTLSEIPVVDVPNAPTVPEQQGVAAYVPKSKRVNLSDLFIDGHMRDQGGIGSCHTFAAIAVLESAYARQYGRRIRLSEGDLFLRRMVLNNDIFHAILRGGSISMFMEGGYITKDVALGLKTGVANDFNYDNFYHKYITIQSNTAGYIARFIKKLDSPSYTVDQETKDRLEEGNAERLRNELIKDFNLEREDVRQTREENKLAFRGFKAKTETFAWQAVSEILSPTPADARCREKSSAIAERLVMELDAGRPVGVCMYWGRPSFSNGHCVAFIGYEIGDNGISFQVRNSWGGSGSSALEDNKLCRVFQIVSVLTPNDQVNPQ